MPSIDAPDLLPNTAFDVHDRLSGGGAETLPSKEGGGGAGNCEADGGNSQQSQGAVSCDVEHLSLENGHALQLYSIRHGIRSVRCDRGAMPDVCDRVAMRDAARVARDDIRDEAVQPALERVEYAEGPENEIAPAETSVGGGASLFQRMSVNGPSASASSAGIVPCLAEVQCDEQSQAAKASVPAAFLVRPPDLPQHRKIMLTCVNVS